MLIQFSVNYPKALEAVLWVLSNCKGLNLYNLLKVIFHADYISVNKYGAPVTGDNYLAMHFGTVPDAIYNGLIKQDELCMSALGIESVPIKHGKDHILSATRQPNLLYLSESDFECLGLGIKEYAGLSFNEVKAKNHSHPAYQKTFKKSPNTLIDWFDLIENDDTRQELLHNADCLVV